MLLQLSSDLVPWWPWGAEALEEAQRLGKLVLVFLEYPGCYWGGVMAGESFCDPYIADLMDRHYVCIRVDKEEHPALDALFLEVLPMLGEPAGWPITLFCLPDGRPFFGGTYFPKEEAGSRVPFPQLLMRVREYFLKTPQDFIDNAAAIVQNLEHNSLPLSPGRKVSNETLFAAATGFLERMDPEHGGLGTAPKFPCSRLLQFLLALAELPDCPQELAQKSTQAALKTLDAMANGGLYDAVQGGFFRYTNDRAWQQPHPEKRLYDQGLLLEAYAKGFERTANPRYAEVMWGTIAQNELLEAPRVLLSWHCVWILGLCAAAKALERPELHAQASLLADALWERMQAASDLKPLAYPGQLGAGYALLDDYALFAQALWTLGQKPRATQLINTALERFHDPHRPGYFLTQKEHPLLPVRKKIWTEAALPCGQSSLLYVLTLAQHPAATPLLEAYPHLEYVPSALLAVVLGVHWGLGRRQVK